MALPGSSPRISDDISKGGQSSLAPTRGAIAHAYGRNVIVLVLPPLGAVAAGYITQSLAIEYATLSLFAALAVIFYLLVIGSQGESLQRREVEVLEAVREPTDD